MRHAPQRAGELFAQPALTCGEQHHRELGSEQHRQQHEDRAQREIDEDEREPVALEVIALALVPVELVLVVDVGARVEDDPAAGHPHPPTEILILVVEEELFAEAAERQELVAADRHRRAARGHDVLQLRRLVGERAVALRPAEAADVDHVAGRVEELRLLQQAQARHGDPDARIVERPCQLCDRPRHRDGIGIQEDDDVAGGELRAEVAPGAEAVVLV